MSLDTAQIFGEESQTAQKFGLPGGGWRLKIREGAEFFQKHIEADPENDKPERDFRMFTLPVRLVSPQTGEDVPLDRIAGAGRVGVKVFINGEEHAEGTLKWLVGLYGTLGVEAPSTLQDELIIGWKRVVGGSEFNWDAYKELVEKVAQGLVDTECVGTLYRNPNAQRDPFTVNQTSVKRHW